jgi:hypothetical protein
VESPPGVDKDLTWRDVDKNNDDDERANKKGIRKRGKRIKTYNNIVGKRTKKNVSEIKRILRMTLRNIRLISHFCWQITKII